MTNLWSMMELDLRAVFGGNVRTLAFLGLVLVAAALFGGTAMGVPMAATVASILSLNVFTADSLHGLTRLHGSLPVARRTVITSHFLVALGLMLTIVAGAVTLAALGDTVRGEPSDALLTGLLLFGVLSVVIAAQFPFQVRYGHQPARVILIALMGVVALGFVFVATVGATFLETLETGSAEGSLTVFPWLVAGIAVVVWVVSYAVSRRIYERQDH